MPRSASVLKLQADSKELKAAIRQVRAEMKSLTKAVGVVATNSDKANASVTKLGKRMRDTGRRAGNATKHVNRFSASVARASRNVKSLAPGLLTATGLIYGAQRAFRAATGHALAFDRQLVGITKTTRITGANLEVLRDHITAISNSTGIDRNEIGEAAKIGGQLGINDPAALAPFAEVITKLTRATNLTAENAALALSRLLILTGTDIRRGIRDVGDALVHLGNNLPAREDEIASMAEALSGVFGQFKEFGFSAVDVLGVAGAVASVRGEAQSANTAFLKMLQTFTALADTGGPELDAFARHFGRTTEQMKHDIENNLSDVFVDFLDSLKNFSPNERTQLLARFGSLDDRRSQKQALRLPEVVKAAFDLARTAEELNEALEYEINAIRNSASGQFDIAVVNLKNSFDDLTRDILENVIPGLQALADWADAVLNDPTGRREAYAAAVSGNNGARTPAAAEVIAGIEARARAAERPATKYEEIVAAEVDALDRAVIEKTKQFDEALNNVVRAQLDFSDAEGTATESGRRNILMAREDLLKEIKKELVASKAARDAKIADAQALIKAAASTEERERLEAELLRAKQAAAEAAKIEAAYHTETGDILARFGTRSFELLDSLRGFGASDQLLADQAALRDLRGRRIGVDRNLDLTGDQEAFQLRQIEAGVADVFRSWVGTAQRGGPLGNIDLDQEAFARGARRASEEAREISRLADAQERERTRREQAELDRKLLIREASDERKLTKMLMGEATDEEIAHQENLLQLSRDYFTARASLEGEALDAALAGLDRRRAELERSSPDRIKREEAERVREEFKGKIIDPLAEALRGNTSIKDAFDYMLADIASTLYEKHIIEPFKKGISNLLDYALEALYANSRGPGPAGGPIPGFSLGGAIGSFLGIPPLANGGDIRRGGLALVGEMGPELLSMPAGARVTPLSGGTGAVGNVNITYNIQSEDEVAMERVIQRNLPMITEHTTNQLESNAANNSAFARAIRQ